MKKYLLYALGLLFILLFIDSCVIAYVDYPEGVAGRPLGEFHKDVSFDTGGTLSLENVDGDIEILGWDKNEVEVSAERKGPFPYRRGLYWAGVPYRLKIDFDKFENFIKVKFRPEDSDKEFTSVNFYINTPHSIHLKDIIGKEGNVSLADLYGEAVIDLQKGEVKVENFSGSLAASVAKGSVTASLYDLRAEDEIRITVKQGDIAVNLQPEVKARVEASAPEGNISSDFDLKEPLPAKKISAKIGEEGALLSLISLKGDIRINKLKK
jgi:hypothetical protein